MYLEIVFVTGITVTLYNMYVILQTEREIQDEVERDIPISRNSGASVLLHPLAI